MTTLFNEIGLIDSRTLITQKIAGLLDLSTPQEASIIVNLSLGQLYPPYYNMSFNIAEKTVLKTISQLLEVDVDVLQKMVKEVGDCGDVLAKYTWKYECQLTVEQLYNELLAIQNIDGTGSVEAKINALAALLSKLDMVSAKCVVRIVIGKLRLGFSDMTLLDALSIMAVKDKSARQTVEHAYNICVDIGKITYELKKNGLTFIEQKKVEIGIPIMPAAAERLPTAQAIIEKIGACVAQPKLDGFRLQIHIDKTAQKPRVHFFSRNLKDMSFMFPDLVNDLLLLPVKQIIAEGEAIVFDPHVGTFLPFQDTVKRKRKHDIDAVAADYPLKLFVFDILFLDGKELLELSHAQRRTLLKVLFDQYKSVHIELIEERALNTSLDLESYFYEMIGSGLEGLVVKKPDALYRPGKRDFNWIKLKRQEEGHLNDTIDCVLLGYYKGKGKRTTFGVGALLVGIYNKECDRFETIAKIGTGLTDQEWIDIKNKADAFAVHEQPHNVICSSALTPDVWVVPAIVCMIRADEITLSPVHAACKTEQKQGYALRFPRFMGYRVDKAATDATTDKEIQELYKIQFNKYVQ